MLRLVSSLFILIFALACTHGHCRSSKATPHTENMKASPSSSDLLTMTQEKPNDLGAVTSTSGNEEKVSMGDRVKVFKPDGSLQCGMGKTISLSAMQKDLGKIKVYNSENKNDGMMRIQVCGSATGQCNVYEIDKKDLESAIKSGFKEWIF